MSGTSAPLGPVGLRQLRDLLTDELPGWFVDLLQDQRSRTGCGRNNGHDSGHDAMRLRDQIVVTPVIDTTGQTRVDAYEIPPPMREALDHGCGFETFPWGTLDARRCQGDHTERYDHGPPDGRPPPGQTRLGNLGPLAAGHHNLKTHHGWTCHQPLPGLYLWRTPSGHWYQVDHTGTRPLGRHTPAILRQRRERPGSHLEVAFGRFLVDAAA